MTIWILQCPIFIISTPYSFFPQSRDERKAETIMHMFETLDRRKKRGQGTVQATPEETKMEAGEAEVPSLTAGNCVPNTGAVGGISTRRTSFAALVVLFIYLFIFLSNFSQLLHGCVSYWLCVFTRFHCLFIRKQQILTLKSPLQHPVLPLKHNLPVVPSHVLRAASPDTAPVQPSVLEDSGRLFLSKQQREFWWAVKKAVQGQASGSRARERELQTVGISWMENYVEPALQGWVVKLMSDTQKPKR